MKFSTPTVFTHLVFTACGIFSTSLSYGAKELSNEFQTSIVQAYSENRCDSVREICKGLDLGRLRPNVMAIAAFCEPKGTNPETLFARAEAASPTGDLILVLHARYRSKIDAANNTKTADPLWEKVLMIARNDYFRTLAKDHLAGVASKESDQEALNLSSSTGFFQFGLSGIHKTNALPQELTVLNAAPANGAELQALVSYRKWYPYGSIALRYESIFDQYPGMSAYNYWNNMLEVPVAVHVASTKDIIFRPFLGYSRFASSSKNLQYGLGMKGVVYKNEYIQSVQAILYAEDVYLSQLKAQGGAHYRFEYTWDFFPQYFNISTILAVEHVSAKSTPIFLGSTGTFEMSHNDMTVGGKIERDFPKFTIGIEPRLRFRFDSGNSIYNNRITGVRTVKTRRDWDATLQTNISVPIANSLQIHAWYEFNRVWSNMAEQDYTNWNFQNHTVGLGLKASLSTY